MTVVAIIQPSYLPWKGYFSQVMHADHFVFLDNVQYDKRGWRNRNRIRTANGPKWITIPVHASGSHDGLLIRDVDVVDKTWASKHLQMIEQSYAKAPHFERWNSFLREMLTDIADYDSISAIASESVERLSNEVGLTTEFHTATEVLGDREISSPTDRLVRLAASLDASVYLSGPAAKEYLDVGAFAAENMNVAWMEYNYPVYPTVEGSSDGDFDHTFFFPDVLFGLDTDEALTHLASAPMIMDDRP